MFIPPGGPLSLSLFYFLQNATRETASTERIHQRFAGPLNLRSDGGEPGRCQQILCS